MKKTTFILMIIFSIGCSHQKVYIKESTIERLSKYDIKLPSADIALLLFVKGSDNNMYRLNINTLYNIFHRTHIDSDIDFKAFVSNSLNQKMSIDSHILKANDGVEFPINEEINQTYNGESMSQFINKYCTRINDKRFEVKHEYASGQRLNSILYFFFINNYNVLLDDYAGAYEIEN
jgi:hypothetical protein